MMDILTAFLMLMPAWLKYFTLLQWAAPLIVRMALAQIERQGPEPLIAIEDVMHRVAPRAVFLIHGTLDNRFRPDHSRVLFDMVDTKHKGAAAQECYLWRDDRVGCNDRMGPVGTAERSGRALDRAGRHAHRSVRQQPARVLAARARLPGGSSLEHGVSMCTVLAAPNAPCTKREGERTRRPLALNYQTVQAYRPSWVVRRWTFVWCRPLDPWHGPSDGFDHCK